MNDSENNPDKVKIFNTTTGNIEETEKIIKTEEEWKKLLTPEQFKVMRLKETEKAFSNQCPIPPKGKSGIYRCQGCNTDLFIYNTKFESGTGWPSFFEPISQLNVTLKNDNSFGMQRTEVLCARCDAHLGHVFNDGPAPSGKRYCINTIALKFSEYEVATFAAGCFWGVESEFQNTKGVLFTKVGYTGGSYKFPTYEDVCSGKTGHAESIEILFDRKVISYNQLLDIFWKMHDPTTLNKQGPDIGQQYRSAIFFHTTEQEKEALASKEKLEESKIFNKKIVTEITKANEFYPAEEYHQKYNEKHGIKGCRIRLKN